MESPTLLCIDDRPQMLALRKAALEPQGFSVRTAVGGFTAIRILEEENRIAAVLLEYKLEGLDAEAVAYQIKLRFPTLPIILVSAYADMPGRILWLVDEYVLKSELPEGLVRIVKSRTQIYRKVTNSDGGDERGECHAAAA